MKDADDFDETVKEAEKKRIEEETLKFKAEKDKIILEIEQLKKNLNKKWYKKEKFIQIVVAAILSISIFGYYFYQIVIPLHNAKSIRNDLELAEKERALSEKDNDLKKKDAELKETKELLDRAWEKYDKDTQNMENQKKSIIARYEKILKEFKQNQNENEEIQKNLEELKGYNKIQENLLNTPLTIENGILSGKELEFISSPNTGNKFEQGKPDKIIFHYTGGDSLESVIRIFTNKEKRASVHIVIDRNGKIVQLVPLDRIAWHAGRVYSKESIGIELVNAGRLEKDGNRFRAWFGKIYENDDVEKVNRENQSEPTYWHKYTDIQIKRTEQLALFLTTKFNIKEILGHYEITKGKMDPGPLFPLDRIRKTSKLIQ